MRPLLLLVGLCTLLAACTSASAASQPVPGVAGCTRYRTEHWYAQGRLVTVRVCDEHRIGFSPSR